VRKLRRRQDIAFDPATGANEQRLDFRLQPNERSRDGECGIEMTAGAAARDEDSHHAGAASGSVAAAPCTRSFTLPMFTSSPVMNSDSTRFDRP